MTKQEKIKVPTGLDLLRQPFPEHQISKLPKPTKDQTDAVKKDYTVGVRCQVCGGWHHPKVIHLDYVGHAALTDRLLDVDPSWYWEPVATFENGLPAFDEIGGLWIRLHILGQNRIGYGCADGKSGGDAKKEVIGDALRNAAMRFGAALDLWHKGDLHVEPEKEWRGPLKLSALKKALRELSADINSVEDSGSMNELMSQSKELREQCEHDLPEWFDGLEKAIDKAVKRTDGK
jgi:hypothetical protein